MKVFDEGKVLIPLFHQTSSLFLPSIREVGLGAVNPHEKLRTYDFLRELLELASRLKEIPLSSLDLNILRRMANQEVTSGGFNFRHGGVYLSPSQKKVAGYARRNPYGSELLSESLRLYQTLKSLGDDAGAIGSRYPVLIELIELIVTPLMVVVRDVSLDHLRSELGCDPKPELEKMQYVVDKLGPDQGRELWGTHAFELGNPIPVGEFGVYGIVWKEPSTHSIAHRLEKL